MRKVFQAWAPKNCCFWTVVLEDSWESLGLQGDPTSPFWRRSTLGFLWKEWCWSWNSSTLATSCEELTHWKNSDAGRDWGQEEKGTTENEMAGWHHSLDGRESEWTPGVGDEQGGLACCDSWGRRELDTTEWLNWTELNWNMKMEVLDFSQDEIHWSNLLITSYLLHHLSIIMISFSSPRIGQRNVSEALAS